MTTKIKPQRTATFELMKEAVRLHRARQQAKEELAAAERNEKSASTRRYNAEQKLNKATEAHKSRVEAVHTLLEHDQVYQTTIKALWDEAEAEVNAE